MATWLGFVPSLQVTLGSRGRPLRDYLFLSPSPACRGPHVLSTFLWPPQGLNAMKAADRLSLLPSCWRKMHTVLK